MLIARATPPQFRVFFLDSCDCFRLIMKFFSDNRLDKEEVFTANNSTTQFLKL